MLVYERRLLGRGSLSGATHRLSELPGPSLTAWRNPWVLWATWRAVSRLMRRSISAILLLLWTLPVPAATLPGRVLWVTDGDTLVVLGPGHAQHEVQLAGVDAPELNQPYGVASKNRLSRRIAGRFVVVNWNKRDRYKRILGTVLLSEQDVCLEQVRAGLAWRDKRYQGEQRPSERRRYARAEQQAQEAKRGLWAGPDPIPPWEWRRGRRAAEEQPTQD